MLQFLLCYISHFEHGKRIYRNAFGCWLLYGIGTNLIGLCDPLASNLIAEQILLFLHFAWFSLLLNRNGLLRFFLYGLLWWLLHLSWNYCRFQAWYISLWHFFFGRCILLRGFIIRMIIFWFDSIWIRGFLSINLWYLNLIFAWFWLCFNYLFFSSIFI